MFKNNSLYRLDGVLSELSLEAHNIFVNTFNGHVHNKDFTPIYGDMFYQGISKLEKFYGFHSIKVCSLEDYKNGKTDDLFKDTYASVSNVIENTLEISNIVFLYKKKQYNFIRFYKQVIKPAVNENSSLRTILSSTSLIVWVPKAKKSASIILYSVSNAFFSLCQRLIIGPKSCPNIALNYGDIYARQVLFGTNEESREGFLARDNNLLELSANGVLLNSAFRQFLEVNDCDRISGVSVQRPNKSINLGRGKGIILENLPETYSFFVRSNNDFLSIVRYLGLNRFGKKQYSWVETPINRITDSLQIQESF